jgi:uncharacterized protein (TIGR03435 family)
MTFLGALQPSSAQSPARGAPDPGDPAFDVASIKPNESGARGSRGAQTPGRFTVTNTTVFAMIQTAYGIRDVQVTGGPGWMKTNRYDINAVRPANATREQLPGMLRNLLAERFALKVHHETRALAAANLVMARSDRRLGPHLQTATDADADCTSGPPPGFDPTKGLPPCSYRIMTGRLSVRGFTMARFAQQLEGAVQDHPFIVDETHLDGAFNIDLLEFRPDGLSDTPPPDWPGVVPWPAVDAPSIYTAIQDQLGLKLEFRKDPIDVIVIDHMEPPAPD